jgi:starch phosphorylase
VAERLVQGIDLWINTPRRPWEACGTSGMKALVNGGLNLSELDGWWAEAYAPEVGWAIGDRKDRGDDPAWDAAEADALYTLLEGDITSAFYTRDAHDVPRGWVARMRESMARLTPAFSANRTVREYTTACYLPAAAAWRERDADNARLGAAVLARRQALERAWPTAAFGPVAVQTDDASHRFRVQLDLGSLDPDDVQVELFAEGRNGNGPERHPLSRVEAAAGAKNRFVYTATVARSRPARDFTPRLIPVCADALVPLEVPLIRWGEPCR